MAQFFNYRDLKLAWERNPANDDNGDIFKDYQVTVAKSSAPTVILRTEYVVEPAWTYAQDDMINDFGGDPPREIIVSVRERDTFLRLSPALSDTLINLSPVTPTFSLRPGFEDVQINIQPNTLKDLAGYMVFRGDTAGFTANDASMIYKGPAPFYRDAGLPEDTTYYYKVAAYDVFDDTVANLNVSGSLVATTSSVTGKVVGYEFKDIVFTPNDPALNSVSWTAGTVVKSKGATVTTFSIAADVAAWTTGEVYIYFDEDAEALLSTTNLVVAYGDRKRLLATYKGGTELLEGINDPIIDGSKILAGTIGAGQLVAGSAVITGTAQIGTGVIETANIKDLAVGETKIADDAITTNKIFASAITAGKIATDAITADKVAANAITTDKLAANAITADKINANAVTTDKIAANAITTAKIAAGSITAASGIIADLAVTTLKIGDDAVTIPRYAYHGDDQPWPWPDDGIWRGTVAVGITRVGKPTMIQMGQKVRSNTFSYQQAYQDTFWQGNSDNGYYRTVTKYRTVTTSTTNWEFALMRGSSANVGNLITPTYSFVGTAEGEAWDTSFVDMDLGSGYTVYTLRARLVPGANNGGVILQRYLATHQFRK